MEKARCVLCIAMTFRVFKYNSPILLGNKLRPQGKVTVQFPDGLREAKAAANRGTNDRRCFCQLRFGADESRCNCYDQWRMLKHYAGSCVAPGEFRTKLDSGITDDGIAEDGWVLWRAVIAVQYARMAPESTKSKLIGTIQLWNWRILENFQITVEN